ncbi:aspartate dehydrogenase [Methanocalculus alkaliphilus]|uniref:aspartate dehydrogenase n=1 Tax=Methanocalculus alkaliphilus TaxID=768730 RepID=UPI0020A02BF6|nr:aspartate dehydrogenase [Methanocalculus alkaliphilus]MCP1716041.1 aspartate dehydrogenase [Methanocalculus alkaliphilus]
MITVGLLGCGNIGHIIAKHQKSFSITAVYDQIEARADELAAASDAHAYTDFTTFLSADFDIVVEAASVAAAQEYGEAILRSGRDFVVMSVGALSDTDFRERLVRRAKEMGRKIYVPSGAVMGLDNIKVGQISAIDTFLLRTTKSPASLSIRADAPTMIFSGKAHECIRDYPKNVNVSEALTLAAGHEVDVELWVDPKADRNIHEIFIEGEFGDAYIRVRNIPSPDNPATSYLAALSILTLLENLDNPLVIGT